MQKSPNDHASAIALENVQVTLPSKAGPVAILQGIDLHVAEGETVAIVGPSGAGKSTLLMVMAGLEKATRGTVTISGQYLSPLNEDQLATLRAKHIGIVFQSFHLVPTMTALENVALPLEFLDRSDAFLVAEAALAEVGLAGRISHFPAQMSGGEKQRVALARAIVAKPSLIFADEPTGNLDQRTGEQVMDLLFALQKRSGTTLLLITHDPALAARCGRIIKLADGRITETAPKCRVPAS